MIDFAFLAFIGIVLALGLRRPFLWVLLYIYVDILAPQRIGFGIITTLPVSLIAFAAAFGGWLVLDRKKGARFSARQGLMLALLAWCWFTTMNADFPAAAAAKWDWVWKALLFAVFLPLTMTTRLRIEAVLLTIVLVMSIIIIGPGIKVLMGGGGYENRLFLVNDNTGLYESSILACAAIAIIPIALWLARHGTIFPPDWRVRLFTAGLIFAGLLIPIGTEARTGLVCIAALGLLLLRHVRRKALFAALALIAGLIAVPFLPASFTERMSTIGSYQEDTSASTRVAVWQWTLDYVAENPAGGGFDAFRGNSFTYEMPVVEGEGNTTLTRYVEVTDTARAYHSAYFEVLGEQGYFGALLWALLQLSGLASMWRIRSRWKNRALRAGWEDATWQAPLAIALAQSQIVLLVGALFVGIAYQPIVMLLLAVQIGFASYLSAGEAARRRELRRTDRARGASGNAINA